MLDCEPDAKYPDASIAWVGVTQLDGTTVEMWAQTGYIRYRSASGDSSTVYKKRYAEVQYGTNEDDRWMRFGDFPAAGAHRFTWDLSNAANGTWTFYYAGSGWISESFDAWKNQTDTHADYHGEIHHKKTQMVGTEPDTKKCQFTSCKYRQSGGTPALVGFAAAHVKSDDPDEWGAELVGTAPSSAFNIWDKKPPFSPNA